MSSFQVCFLITALVTLGILRYGVNLAMRAGKANGVDWVRGQHGWRVAHRRWDVTPPKAKWALVLGLLLAVAHLAMTIVFHAQLQLKR